MDRPHVVAHRGLHDVHRAENFLGAVHAALDAGISHVAVDVRRARDGVLLLLHDATLDRTTTSSSLLASRLASDLDAVRLLDGSAMPPLVEVLALCRDRIVVCADVK